ncbi:hypothetical protein BGZ76_003138 [Entomortierella beljakovae]|nr:hypothetical protein BGZ76_003138 [Entomortierella beljakovae]
MMGGGGSSGGSSFGLHQDSARKGADMGSVAFRHGSLDQRKDYLGMEDAMGKMDITQQDDIAFGSFPEDLHHQHSLFSAPLNTGREKRSDSLSMGLPFTQDPRPIPPFAGDDTSASRQRHYTRTGSGSNQLPRLRTKTIDDNESLNEMNSADSINDGRHRQRIHGHSRLDDDDDDVEDEDSREIRPGHDRDFGKSKANTSINDDDEMLFIMSELSPGSTSGHDTSGALSSGAHGRGILPLTGTMLNLRSQTQSPSMNPHHGSGSNGSGTSTSSHIRLFGRPSSGNGNGSGNINAIGNLVSEGPGSSRSNSRSQSRNHSRVGSNSGSTNNQNSTDLLRQPGSNSDSISGPMDGFDVPSRSSTPPPFPGFVPGVGAFEAILEGRRMSRGGSDRGVNSGASSGGQNSYYSDSRGGRIEGW